MMHDIGFDNNKYIKEQSDFIKQRIQDFGGKLYLEIGGKIIHDLHAARVLPGFDPDAKIKVLQGMSEQIEVLICIYANDIQGGKSFRGDLGATSDVYALKMIDDLRQWGLKVTATVITRFNDQGPAESFANKLERRGVAVFKHRAINGYPNDVDTIASNQGFGINPYIPTTRPLILVVAPGPGSGKLGTCLSQLYHEHHRGVKAGYAKWETFPVWNLPLKHPVNLAYEASTADLGDINLIDHFHLEAYAQTAINYNRDLEIFPVLKKILAKINGQLTYKSPTDMGVNRIGFAVINDEIVREAAQQEIIRRYFRYSAEYAKGLAEAQTITLVQRLMEDLNLKPEDRAVVLPARHSAHEAQVQDKGNKGVFAGAAAQLADGSIITSKNSPLLHASSSLFINAVKKLASIPDEIHLLSPQSIEAIGRLKTVLTGETNLSLNLEETLIALSIASSTNPTVEMALSKIGELEGMQVHLTHIPKPGDENAWRKLKVNLTYDPIFSSAALSDL